MDRPAIDPARISALRRRWAIVGVVLVALSCGLGAWILVRGNHPFVVDTWWNTLWAGIPDDPLLFFALVMNRLGGTWVAVYLIPLGGALVLFVVRKRWSALYFLAASVASAAGVQILKHLFGRARPEDIIVVSDYGSFPSGHTANAATIALVAALLFPRLWVYIVGGAWVVLMAFSRTYLHAHWASDTLGGALIGVGAALLVAVAFAPGILRERSRPRLGDPAD
jgi:membrane-associated phospholipid phosphatase